MQLSCLSSAIQPSSICMWKFLPASLMLGYVSHCDLWHNLQFYSVLTILESKECTLSAFFISERVTGSTPLCTILTLRVLNFTIPSVKSSCHRTNVLDLQFRRTLTIYEHNAIHCMYSMLYNDYRPKSNSQQLVYTHNVHVHISTTIDEPWGSLGGTGSPPLLTNTDRLLA